MVQFRKISTQLNVSLKRLTTQNFSKSKEASESMLLVSEALFQLRKLLSLRQFSSNEEEIAFFKEIKAPIHAQLIFHKQVFEIETKRLISIESDITHVIKEKLEQFIHVFQDNQEFILYTENLYTNFDEIYFIRRKKMTPIFISNCDDLFDPEFETSHDKLLSNYMAFKMLKEYFQIEQNSFRPTLKWTGIQAEIVELIYALHTSRKINHGKASLHQIAIQFQYFFKFEIGDFYRVYTELKERKKGRTIFVDRLSEDLNDRMDKDDMKK